MVYILSLIILILLILLARKRKINNYCIDSQKIKINELNKEIEEKITSITELQDKITKVQAQYHNELNKKSEDLDNYFANQRELRQSELDIEFERQERERKESLDLRLLQFTQEVEEKVIKTEAEAEEQIKRLEKAQQDIANITLAQEERFEALLAPIKQYEKEKQERLFYTIQVPEEYKTDIDFLLTTVAAKIQHPDIINKLIWSEYVKPYIDQTFKRVGIQDKPGIYKLTNLESNKCYIGKSTNVKKRLSDHFKASVGINIIADQLVHHEILRTGYWNWTIEVIIYCDKDKLNELEKYYIDFFKSNEWGFNKSKGGEG